MCTRKIIRILMITLASITSIAVISFSGGIPNTLNYQGTLTDSTGKPVTVPAKPVTFKLYTSALGGSAFWTEPQTIPVNNGQFSAVLGSSSINTLPTDKFTGNTYVGVTVDPGPEMLPRQKMTSVAYALKAPDEIPRGVIVMWSGAVGQIPAGWALCDGNNGTPNLKDRFIVGVGDRFGNGKPRNLTGGFEDHILTVNEMPSHTHTQNAHNHGISDPTHRHGIYSEGDSTSSSNAVSGADDRVRLSNSEYSATGISILDATPTNQNTGGGAAHNNLPPYYALAFIMKL